MIIVRIIMNVLPDKLKEVRQTLLSLIGPPGNRGEYLSFNIFSDIEDGTVFNLISEWETRQDLVTYIMSDKFSVLLGTKSLLGEPLKIQISTVSRLEGMETVNAIRKKGN